MARPLRPLAPPPLALSGYRNFFPDIKKMFFFPLKTKLLYRYQLTFHSTIKIKRHFAFSNLQNYIFERISNLAVKACSVIYKFCWIASFTTVWFLKSYTSANSVRMFKYRFSYKVSNGIPFITVYRIY